MDVPEPAGRKVWENLVLRRPERRQAGREQKEAGKRRMFGLKQQKRKEKHRGRLSVCRK